VWDGTSDGGPHYSEANDHGESEMNAKLAVYDVTNTTIEITPARWSLIIIYARN
jgi:hypothetical protein